MIEKPTLDVLTQPATFYDLSVSRNLFAKAEMRQFGASETDELSRNFKFLNTVIFVSFNIVSFLNN